MVIHDDDCPLTGRESTTNRPSSSQFGCRLRRARDRVAVAVRGYTFRGAGYLRKFAREAQTRTFLLTAVAACGKGTRHQEQHTANRLSEHWRSLSCVRLARPIRVAPRLSIRLRGGPPARTAPPPASASSALSACVYSRVMSSFSCPSSIWSRNGSPPARKNSTAKLRRRTCGPHCWSRQFVRFASFESNCVRLVRSIGRPPLPRNSAPGSRPRKRR